MNKYHQVSFLFFAFGVVFFALGVLNGEIKIGIAFVFPFLVGSGFYAFLGFILIFVAIIFFMFGFADITRTNGLNVNLGGEHPLQKKTSVKGGGVVLVGPIPIVFGSNWKITVVMVMLAVVFITVTFFVFR